MIKDYFRLAYLSVRQRKVRSWLTMLGIFMGIAAIVALVSLSQGLKGAIGQQFVNLGSDKLLVQAAGSGFGPPGTAVSNPLTKNDKETAEKVKGVDLAVGRLVRIVELEFKDDLKYGYAVTMPEDLEERNLVIEVNNYKIDQGKFFERKSSYGIVLGSNFAKDYFKDDVEVRDKIYVQGTQFTVTGILKKSGNPQQDDTVILAEKGLREVLRIPEAYDVIPLKVKAGENVEAVGESVKKELRKKRGVEEGKEDFAVETPQQVIAILNNILLVVQGVLIGIAAISLIVGAIGIMNTMYTAVLERTKEIGVMKAVGANRLEIMLLFLIESGFLGLFGGLIGVILGFSISKSVEIFATQIFDSKLIQAQFSLSLLLGTLLFAFLMGAVSGALPARQAAKLQPVEAFRK